MYTREHELEDGQLLAFAQEVKEDKGDYISISAEGRRRRSTFAVSSSRGSSAVATRTDGHN